MFIFNCSEDIVISVSVSCIDKGMVLFGSCHSYIQDSQLLVNVIEYVAFCSSGCIKHYSNVMSFTTFNVMYRTNQYRWIPLAHFFKLIKSVLFNIRSVYPFPSFSEKVCFSKALTEVFNTELSLKIFFFLFVSVTFKLKVIIVFETFHNLSAHKETFSSPVRY